MPKSKTMRIGEALKTLARRKDGIPQGARSALARKFGVQKSLVTYVALRFGIPLGKPGRAKSV